MQEIQIADKKIGEGYPTFIIAEAGLNHNGNIDLAKELVAKAAKIGANAIKFQSYHTEDFVSKGSKFYQLFKNLELSEDEFKKLSIFAKQKNIIFLSTPLDLNYVDVLNDLAVPAFKIASGDLTFVPLLKKVAKTKKPVILSTGMATIGEIGDAVSLLKSNGANNVILMQCTSSYPPPITEVNLRSIITLSTTFGCLVGYSDHTLGIETAIAAVALGARVIEKHFTLDKQMKGPDHKLSADPAEFERLVSAIRNVEQALGNGIKRPMECEKQARVSGRRSIVAKRAIRKGERITDDNIFYKRPATGIETRFFEIIRNRRVLNDIASDEIIEWSDLMEE